MNFMQPHIYSTECFLIRTLQIISPFHVHIYLFSVKDVLRSEDPPKFLGCLSFLCQVFATNRDANKDPFEVLMEPVITAVTMLLDSQATNEEISCAAFHVSLTLTQVAILGKHKAALWPSKTYDAPRH